MWQVHCREIQDIMLQGFTRQEQEQFAEHLRRVYQNVRNWREEHPWEI